MSINRPDEGTSHPDAPDGIHRREALIRSLSGVAVIGLLGLGIRACSERREITGELAAEGTIRWKKRIQGTELYMPAQIGEMTVMMPAGRAADTLTVTAAFVHDGQPQLTDIIVGEPEFNNLEEGSKVTVVYRAVYRHVERDGVSTKKVAEIRPVSVRKLEK